MDEIRPLDAQATDEAGESAQQHSSGQPLAGDSTADGSSEPSALVQLEHLSEQLSQEVSAPDTAHDTAEPSNPPSEAPAEFHRVGQDPLHAQTEREMAQEEVQRVRQVLTEQLRQREEQLETTQRELYAANALARQAQRELAVVQEDAAAEKQFITRTRLRLESLLRDNEQQRDDLLSEQAETKRQRRRIAHELQIQHAELLRQRTELEKVTAATHEDCNDHLSTANSEAAELRLQVAQMHKVLNARADELTELRQEVCRLTDEITRMNDEHDVLSQQLAVEQVIRPAADRAAYEQLQADRDRLARELEETQILAGGPRDTDQQKSGEWQRRFETAVDDVRDLKHRNAELEAQLVRRDGGPPIGQLMDWESQKQRLLASLEDTTQDGENLERREERLTIEGAIRITDDVVAAKDREIAELQQLMHQPISESSPSVGGSVRVTELLNQDEVIRQERERLDQLQAEWREKLRTAEIEISMERAKIARERATIEDKLQIYQTQAHYRTSGDYDPVRNVKPAKLVRGRWRALLGLKDRDDE